MQLQDHRRAYEIERYRLSESTASRTLTLSS